MLRPIYITLLLLLPLQGVTSDAYMVKLAVYNNVSFLQEEIDKLPNKLKKTIKIEKRGKQHIACSLHTEKKEMLKKLLPSYKKVFPDAFIAAYQAPELNTTEVNVTVEANTTSPETKPIIIYTPYSRKIVNPTTKNISLYKRFHQKTLYLCAYGADTVLPNVLIHVTFFDQEVVYTPIMGDVASKREKYTIEENKLYISHKDVFDPEMYKTLEEITPDYYLISTWVGKRKTSSIRYYFDLEKAEAYVKTLR